MEPCKACSCGCIPVSSECIVDLSELPNWRVVKNNQVANAVNDIDDLIGLKCAEELCSALKAAIEEVNTSGGAVEDYLPAKWWNLITNKHFKTWFANRVAWHWFEGSSITELRKVGLITATNADEQFKNGFQMADEAQRKRLQCAAANYASGARKKFLEAFWFCNICDYSCAPSLCDCKLRTCSLCNPEGEGGRGLSVGMDVI
jgi:hypothetical protein